MRGDAKVVAILNDVLTAELTAINPEGNIPLFVFAGGAAMLRRTPFESCRQWVQTIRRNRTR